MRRTPKSTLKKFMRSRKALAIPVTYLILFASLLAIISITYGFAVARISAKGAALKLSVAKQNMQTLDDAVRSVAWSFGASKTAYMEDCGGVFQTQSSKDLSLTLTDEQTFAYTVLNSSIGKVCYVLEASTESQEGLYVKGDSRAIINQSAYPMTQLYFARGENAQQLTLCYRPMATVLAAGTTDGKPLNFIRVYVISLASSEALTASGSFYVKASALNVTVESQLYNLNSTVSSLALKAVSDGVQTTVWLPIESNAEGAFVNLEILTCHIKIQRVNA
ncbi:hypothetical protein KEJ45_06570 [Candidatus Bathyarchaeota archaeon]|nr:hypothetical protein [Candidatus Bathyarchaeota archaeon]